jgi:hypothetical protein
MAFSLTPSFARPRALAAPAGAMFGFHGAADGRALVLERLVVLVGPVLGFRRVDEGEGERGGDAHARRQLDRVAVGARFAGAPLDPAVRHDVERRDALGDARRMTVAWRLEHDAVADPGCSSRAACRRRGTLPARRNASRPIGGGEGMRQTAEPLADQGIDLRGGEAVAECLGPARASAQVSSPLSRASKARPACASLRLAHRAVVFRSTRRRA